MSAPMPEREFRFLTLAEMPDAYRAMKQRADAAESRLLAAVALRDEYRREWDSAIERNNAAEARVREVEAELGTALDQVMIFGSDIDRLRADREALVPLARYGLIALEDENDDIVDTPALVAGRAVLLRLLGGGDGDGSRRGPEAEAEQGGGGAGGTAQHPEDVTLPPVEGLVEPPHE